jgi:hypothetical protein
MKRIPYLITSRGLVRAVLALLTGVSGTMQAEFSWERVPLFAHLGKWDGPFTADEAQFLARFPYVMLEKTQEYKVPTVSAEEGILRAARQIKAVRPEVKVAYYWNAFIGYEMYAAVATFLAQPEWAIANLDGSLYRKAGGRACYNLGIPELRRWWIDSAAQIIRNNRDAIDLLFVDAVLAASHSVLPQLWGGAVATGVHAGMDLLMTELAAELGTETSIVYNGAGARAVRWEDRGLRYLEWADGVMFEHFAGCSGREPDDGRLKTGWLDEEIALIRQAAMAGKTVFVKGWPRSKPCLNRPGITDEAVMRRELEFPLAAFLIAAEANCYFLYNWGYTNHDGQYLWYAEYDRPLGEPLGPPVRTGSEYVREFAHAWVWVDTAKEVSEIRWLSDAGAGDPTPGS